MRKILRLIDRYIDVQTLFWSDECDSPELSDFDKETYEWMKKEWALIDEMDTIKKEILGLLNGDRTLFNKYLSLGSCIKVEDYEQAAVMKNEILDYGKTSEETGSTDSTL